jgi:hypothetical protein
MTRAYDKSKEYPPTALWIGRVDSVDEDGFFTGTIFDDYETQSDFRVIQVPLTNLLDTELPKVRSGMLFHCEISETNTDLRLSSLEFSEELTEKNTQLTIPI